MAEGSLQDIKDFHDIVRLLEQHPEWRAELRRLVLTEELLALPEQVAQLIRQVAMLTEAQSRTDTRLEGLTEAQMRTEARLEALIEAQIRTEARLGTLTEDVKRMGDDVGKLKGKGLETHYRLHGSPFFGVLLRRAHVLSMEELGDLLDLAIEQRTLSEAEALEVRRADLIVRGTRREDRTLVYLVVEVSWSVDTEDVERAARRAARLAKTGVLALPVAAGETVRPAASELAQSLQVWQMTDAEVIPPGD